uniref:Uncharacterized protein n=1 Tax=Anguilla anguilla TaxID=7936 RepID=A0A0E9S917_ANGAN
MTFRAEGCRSILAPLCKRQNLSCLVTFTVSHP